MTEAHKGVEQWLTKEGVRILQLHYSADPAKDPATPEGKEWLLRELVGYPGGLRDPRWRREMEIDFNAYAGELLFSYLLEYEEYILCDPILNPPPSWELTSGFDYGARNPSAHIVTGWDEQKNPVTLWEYYQKPRQKDETEDVFRARKGYKYTAKQIKEGPYYQRLVNGGGGIVADPTCWNKSQQTERGLKSLAELFLEEGVVLIPGSKGGDMAWYEMLSSHYWANPKRPLWRICRNCTWLWWELKGLRFAEHSPTAQETHNAKDEVVDKNNHASDAVKYDFRMHARQLAKPDLQPVSDQARTVEFVEGKSDVAPWQEIEGGDTYINFEQEA